MSEGKEFVGAPGNGQIRSARSDHRIKFRKTPNPQVNLGMGEVASRVRIIALAFQKHQVLT